MRRKILFTIIIGLLISFTILLLINKVNTDNNKASLPPLDEDEQVIDNPEEEEPEDDYDDSVLDNMKEFFVDAAESTTSFLFRKHTQIAAVGDSLTEGIGDKSGNGGYIGILDEIINEEKQLVEFSNFGHRGHRTKQLLIRLDEPEVSEAIVEANIVLITIGANDIMQVVKENFSQLTIELFTEERIHFESRLNDIMHKITKINPTAKIYLLGIYNPYKHYFHDIKELDEIVDEWSRTGESVTNDYENATFIPMKDIFDNSNEQLFANDNFHPNELGYKRMAERVVNYLEKEQGREQ